MTLATALLIAGVVVLLAVIVQGILATRRAAPRRAAASVPPAEPEGERVEPLLGGEPESPAPTELRPPALRRPSVRLDALIDAIAPLTVDAPVTGELLLGHLPPTRRAGTKPFYVEGLDSETGEWDTPAARPPLRRAAGRRADGQPQRRAQRDRVFGVRAEGCRPSQNRWVRWPTSPTCWKWWRARANSTPWPAPLDAQLTVTLRSNGVAWSVGYLQQCAARQGFVPGVLPGRLVLPGPEEGAPPVLVLGFDAQAALSDDPQQAAVRDATLTLDVPQTPASAEPFPAWHRTATALAEDMDAAHRRRPGPAGHAAGVRGDRPGAGPAVRAVGEARPGGWHTGS